MENNVQEVLIRRAASVFIPSNGDVSSQVPNKLEPITLQFAWNLTRLGYWLSPSDLIGIQNEYRAEPTIFNDIIEAASKVRGAYYDYEPMYPNFPEQVQNMSDDELYINAVTHYFGDFISLVANTLDGVSGSPTRVRLIPKYDKHARPELDENIESTLLTVINDSELQVLTTGLLTQGAPYADQDVNDISTIIDVPEGSPRASIGYRAIEDAITKGIGIKENLAMLTSKYGNDHDFMSLYFTATDVLRLAVAWSGGDTSLSEHTKFHLSRPDRRKIMHALESVIVRSSDRAVIMDIASHHEEWKRLFVQLHPYEYERKHDYRNAVRVLSEIMNGTPKSFDSLVDGLSRSLDDAHDNNDARRVNDTTIELVNLLSTRPGVYARRLAESLRKIGDDTDSRSLIINGFTRIADKVSINVLVQMWNLFNGPLTSELPSRTIHVKKKSLGSVSILIPNRNDTYQADVIDAIEHGLKNRNASVKTYYDNEGVDDAYTVPMGIRSASSGSRIIGRGSRIKVSSDKNVLRLFMHWHDIDPADGGYNRVDLDLSADMISGDLSYAQEIAFYNLRELEAVHSGDLTSAPNGAAEFIDVNINDALKKGYRYIVPTVYNYTGQALNTVPEAWAGVMFREKAGDGEIFEPSTVKVKYDLTSPTVNSTPFIFDMVSREIIWLDASLKVRGIADTIGDNRNAEVNELRSALSSYPMTVRRFLELTTTTVDEPSQADTIIHGWDTDKVLGLLG
jgi:stress response protein SCP2